MELELGLKITRTRDDATTSSTDLWIAKDRAGPLFFSRETDTMFILLAHLKGFRRENIDIMINDDGSWIAISGQKPVQEMVLMGWVPYKKAVELSFRKVFKIPDGVILDRIKAKFNEEKSNLAITMPKLVKGIRGTGIEEVKEEEVDKGRTKTIADVASEENREPQAKEVEEIEQAVETKSDRMEPEISEATGDRFPGKGKDDESWQEAIAETKIKSEEETGQATKLEQFEAMEEVAETFPERENNKENQLGKPEDPQMESMEQTRRPVEEQINEASSKEMQDEAEAGAAEATDQVNLPGSKEADRSETPDARKKKHSGVPKRSKLCPPLFIAGSAIIVSLIVLVINIIRPKIKMNRS